MHHAYRPNLPVGRRAVVMRAEARDRDLENEGSGEVKESKGCKQFAVVKNGKVISHHLDEVFMKEWNRFKDEF